MSRLRGKVVRYVGAQRSSLAGMEGYVLSEERFGPFDGAWVLLAPFRASDRVHVDLSDIRELRRGFTKAFAKKYATPRFEDLPPEVTS